MTVAIDPAKTLADVVTDHPDLARDLEPRSDGDRPQPTHQEPTR
jgi:hypothetical protein